LSAKEVTPTAPVEVQLVHRVLVSWVYASAHVTTNVLGRATVVPWHVTTLASSFAPTEAEGAPVGDGEEPKAPYDAPTSAPTTATPASDIANHLSRRRRSRRFASRKSSWFWCAVDSSETVASSQRGGAVRRSIEATIIVFMGSFKSDDEGSDLGLARLDRRDPMLLHEQVAAEIRRAIAQGEASPGERIPQAKDLAAELGVNTNTVLRALRVLRDEGVIEMGRGRSIRVTDRPDRGAVVVKTKELVELARRHGVHRDELITLMLELPGR
jgi:GntR family transcriptional regulator